jgi:hypothetical protein
VNELTVIDLPQVECKRCIYTDELSNCPWLKFAAEDGRTVSIPTGTGTKITFKVLCFSGYGGD